MDMQFFFSLDMCLLVELDLTRIFPNGYLSLMVSMLLIQAKLNLQVYKARRVATMKLMDDGFEEKAKERKKQKLKMLAEKGSLKKRSEKRKKSGEQSANVNILSFGCVLSSCILSSGLLVIQLKLYALSSRDDDIRK